MSWFEKYYKRFFDDELPSKGWDYKKPENFLETNKKTYQSRLGNWSAEKSAGTMSWWGGRSPIYTGYSSITSKEDSERSEKLLSDVYRTVREFVIILNFPFNVYVQFVGNHKEALYGFRHDSGRRLFVPTKVFDDPTKTNEEVTSITCGAGVHEAAHLLFTEYRVFKSFMNSIRTEMRDTISPLAVENLTEIIFNLIEDERVEDKLLSERPGYLEFIKSHKKYKLEKLKSYPWKNKEFGQFFDNLFRLIRYPEEIDEKVVEKYSRIYGVIRDLINPLPSKTKDVCKVVRTIVELILDSFEDISAESLNREESIEQLDEEFKKLTNSEITDKILYGVDEDSGYDPSQKLIGCKISDNPLIYKLVMGKVEKGVGKGVYFEKKAGDKVNYLKDKDKISKYIPAIKKLISGSDKNYDFVVHGCRYGLLDTTKLAEAYQGVPHVYKRVGHVVTNKTTVCILIDESGSMSGYREVMAREAGILLNEALGSLPGVDLYVYGHTADITKIGDVNLSVYREGNRYNPKYSMSDIKAQCQNRDGQAILEVAKRVRKFTDAKTLMFVLSDGVPAAYGYCGEEAIRDTRKHVVEAEKLGFDIIQISIATVYGVERMFDKYIDITSDVSELPHKLGNIIKKCIVDNKKSDTIL